MKKQKKGYKDMDKLLNINTLSKLLKHALYAFGEKDKKETICNLRVAVSMCEDQKTADSLMKLSDMIEISDISEEEFTLLINQICIEITEAAMKLEMPRNDMGEEWKPPFVWETIAKKNILAAFGNDSCSKTILRLHYLEHVSSNRAMKGIVHKLTLDLAEMNIIDPEKFPKHLAEARGTPQEYIMDEKPFRKSVRRSWNRPRG